MQQERKEVWLKRTEENRQRSTHVANQTRCMLLLQGLRERRKLEGGRDPRLSRLSRAEAPSRLSSFPEDLDYDIEESYESVLLYKNQYMRGRLLHFAVWFSSKNRERDADSVNLVLDNRADPNAKATYLSFAGHSETVLEAIHIAAGLGHVAALEALWSHTRREEQRNLANMPCFVGDRPHYMPIHDAIYLQSEGAAEAAIWLLQHGAQPNATNMDGFTPLHWAAFRGLGRGREKGLEDMVCMLVKSKADLAARTSAGLRVPHFSDKTPLEMAALPGSDFPMSLMHLLAQSFHRDLILTVMTFNAKHYSRYPAAVCEMSEDAGVAEEAQARLRKAREKIEEMTSAEPPPDVVCIQNGVAGAPMRMEWPRYRRLEAHLEGRAGGTVRDAVYGSAEELEGVGEESRDDLVVHEFLVREKGKWQVMDSGVSLLSDDCALEAGRLAVRSCAWVKLQPRMGGPSVYVLSTELTGGPLEDLHFLRLGDQRGRQAERAAELLSAKLGDSAQDCGILVGGLGVGSPGDDAARLREHALRLRSHPQVQADARRLRLSPESVQERFEAYASRPFEVLRGKGWHFVYGYSEVGPTSKQGDLVDHMAVSKQLRFDSAQVFFTTNQEGQIGEDCELPLSDHNAVKCSFHVQPFHDGQGGRSFFDDLCLLSQFNMALADNFARRIVGWPQEECKAQLRRDAQKPGAVDRLADLLFSAPVAAFDLLELSTTKETQTQRPFHRENKTTDVKHVVPSSFLFCMISGSGSLG